jgi:hypothetical protein
MSAKMWRILLVIPAFWTFLGGFLNHAVAQTPEIRLKKITYLTPNLDSSLKAFLNGGFIFDHTEYHPFGPFQITLPTGHQIALMGADTTNTTKQQSQALRQFGRHICSVEFAVSDLESVARVLDSIGVAHSAIDFGRLSIVGFSPLAISFIRDTEDLHPQIQNRYSRISWLVLTANDSTERTMINVFAALKLRKLHEGCCDYWLVGPIEGRTAIRFELPPGSSWASPPPKAHPEPGWLSIEEGGVVYAY